MAICKFHEHSKISSIEEFLEYVETHIDLNDDESVVSAAAELQALANNKAMILGVYAEQLKNIGRTQNPIYSQSSAVLGKGKNKSFVVRTNLWPTIDVASERVRTIESGLFSYDLAHDHNFSFLTANVFGPGYVTDIWEYQDDVRPEGYVGKVLPMRFVETTMLHPYKQIFFRRCRDVHIQHPPERFSVSINLMMPTAEDILTDQYVFDMDSHSVSGFPQGCASSRRVFLMEVAGAIGDGNVAEILLSLADRHPCQRTRGAALKSALSIEPNLIDCLPASVLDSDSYHVKSVLSAHVKGLQEIC